VSTSQRVSRGFHRLGLLTALTVLTAVSPATVQAKVILECVGKSQH
jgi:hypothetical protein